MNTNELDKRLEEQHKTQVITLWRLRRSTYEERLYNASRRVACLRGEIWPPYADTIYEKVGRSRADAAGERLRLTDNGYDRLQVAGLFRGRDFDWDTHRYFVMGGRDFYLGITGRVHYVEQFYIADREEHWQVTRLMDQSTSLSFETFDAAVDTVIEHYNAVSTPNTGFLSNFSKVLRKFLP